jgi:membrane protein
MTARAPETPADITKPSWLFVARKTAREFTRDGCTDLAAALTYYGVLSIFPAMIALFSLLGVVGQGTRSVPKVLGVLRDLGAGSIAHDLEPTLNQIADSSATAGLALVLGLVTALWSASGYVGSFGRAMNRIYEIREGRPFWKLRPLLLFVTLVAIVLAALILLALVLTGGAARAVGDAIGLGSTAVTVWGIAKWPVMLAAAMFVVAVLYYATPNVQQPKFRWISVGAVVAILVWVVASAVFGVYVANFSSYNKTYGTLAGAVVFLLWLWLTNLALLFGAELDSELERSRELQKGIPAEESIQLPPRDTRNIEKTEQQEQEEIAAARELRETAGASSDPDDDHATSAPALPAQRTEQDPAAGQDPGKESLHAP